MGTQKIRPCDKDRALIEKLSASQSAMTHQQPRDYRNCVVRKPWGYEYLIFENDKVAVWFLKINRDHSTSMHCHPQKKTALIILSGTAFCNTLEHRNYLSDFDALIIDKGAFHSTKATSQEGLELIEIESPPNKTDLLRLNDAYGRERDGYEGLSEMETQNLERFQYFFFEESTHVGEAFHYTERYAISLATFVDPQRFRTDFRVEEGALYSPCRGQIVNSAGEVVVDVGETISWVELSKVDFQINGKLVLLMAHQKDRNPL